MKTALVFLVALVAIALTKPHHSSSSGSHEHKRKTHRPHHRTPPPPPPCPPVTTQGTPASTDLPVDPTEVGPIVTEGVTADEPETTPEGSGDLEVTDEALIGVRSVNVHFDANRKPPHHKRHPHHQHTPPPPPPCPAEPTGEVPAVSSESPVAPTEAEPIVVASTAV
ncbi:unnamed protein product [Nippostrongylus brasiliensis]|uniref:Secreted protein n=1 Tax=Nippostrongylus brasiliensis TaxID=27835 RepID=A0A0N4XVE2_NIPBR|nr:unnamed protein product [Nippostrongylus brasiliensis]